MYLFKKYRSLFKKYRSLWVKLITIILLTFLGFSCKSSNNNSFVWHPVENNIPYFNNDHTVIGISNYNKNYGDLLTLLNNYLVNKKSKFKLEKLNLLVDNTRELSVVSIGDQRLIILSQDRLIEYNMITESAVVIAKEGRGPGYIKYSSDMVKIGDEVYVAMQLGKIAVFNCTVKPCNYKKTFKLNTNIYSLALKGDSLAILGYLLGTGIKEPKANKSIVDKGIKVYNNNLNKMGAFCEVYNTNKQWMLLRPFVSNGMVRYSRTQNLFFVIFNRFPFIYVFDGSRDFDLQKSYKLFTFDIGYQKYWPKEGRRRIVMKDHSIISNITVLNGNKLLIQTKTKSNRRAEGGLWVWDQKIRFYLIDFSNSKNYYLGSRVYNNTKQNIYCTEIGCLVSKGGSLYIIK